MKNLLSLGLACSVLLSFEAVGADAGLMADSKQVSAVEYLYADVSDANTILAAIDSGLLSGYQGKNRAAWEELYRKKHSKLVEGLDRLPSAGLSDRDGRAIAATPPPAGPPGTGCSRRSRGPARPGTAAR